MKRIGTLICALLVLFLAPLAGAQIYTVTNLGTLGGTYSVATGINDFGRVVGVSSTTGDVDRHAFLWTKTGGMQDLGTLGGANIPNGTVSIAYGINDRGQVAGASVTTGNVFEHAFLWTKTGGMQDLGTLGGGNSFGFGINNFGQVVGLSLTPSGAAHAFLWTKIGGMQDLATLGGSVSWAYGINNLGQVVGYSLTTGDVFEHAFLWTKTGGMQDLGTLGGTNSVANGINDFGQVVGYSLTTGGGVSPAFLWTKAAGMQDLNNLIPADSGWRLDNAHAINLRGQIVGEGVINGQSHAFLLTPNTLQQ